MGDSSDKLLAVPPAGGPAVPVRERPILFSAPMVRAILEGRKTQTRRVVKVVRGFAHHNILKYGLPYAADPWAVWLHSDETDRVGCLQVCPYGVPGDRLWVKEGWRPAVDHSCPGDSCCCRDVAVRYLANEYTRYVDGGNIPADWKMPKAAAKHPVTALFMPRWASRITLEIADVRVQRVQEISARDARAEGVESCTPYDEFRALWDSINEKRGFDWQSNPWVWCISFRRIHHNGQAHLADAKGASNISDSGASS